MKNEEREHRVSSALRGATSVEVRAALAMLSVDPGATRPDEISPRAWEAARALAETICCEMIEDTATLFRPSTADSSSAPR